VAATALSSGLAWADNHVTLRTVYYREPSTRVVQPVVEVEKDLPGGFDVNTHALVDAITSASAASGTATDDIFTEVRDQAGIRVGKNWSRARGTLAYSYSAESDYWSHILAAGASFRLWGDTATLSLSMGAGFDEVGKRVQGAAPTPALGPGDPCVPNGTRHCPLHQRFAGIGYSQVLSPTLLVQAGYEMTLLDGYLASVYRQVPSKGVEVVPDHRWRNALAARVAKYYPEIGVGLQLHYRYYWDTFFKYAGGVVPIFAKDPLAMGTDPWRVKSHTVEGRAYKSLGRDIEARLTYRYYSQGAAAFWCDLGAPSNSCYASSLLYTSDPKLSPVSTQLLEGKLYWDATRWRGLPVAGWFAAGTFEVSYGYYWQSTSYVGAHILQAGYTIPY
jgi:hypothetical protein